MKKYAIIVAGGLGTRMNTAIPKQFLLVNGEPVVWHTITAFLTAFDDIHIILVLPSSYISMGMAMLAGIPGHRVTLTNGGETRFHSVKNGLNLVDEEAVIFVHDAVRCLVTAALIQRCYDAAVRNGNAIPAVAAVDSLRIETPTGNEVLDRGKVRIIQTPQTFLTSVIKPAFAQPFAVEFTDEASVVEHTGVAICLIAGDADNIKITRPVDLLIATQVIAERQKLSH